MTITETIATDLKSAMKAGEKDRLSTLRMLQAALKNKQIDLRKELSDEEAMDVLKSQVKQLKDALETAVSAGRGEMADGLRGEIVILEGYLPAQLGNDELEKIVKEAVEGSGASSKADMGRAMGAAMKAVAGRADGGRVKEIVARLLPAMALLLFLPAVGLAADPLFAPAPEAQLAETMLRIARVGLVVIGIAAVNVIIKAVVDYMTTAVRDDVRNRASKQMASGFFGTGIVFVLFLLATIALEKIP